MNILIVDDEPDIRKTLSICLETDGHNVVSVGNVRELRNIIERAVILCRSEHIGIGDLPENIRQHDAPVRLGDPVPLSKIEEIHIRRVVSATSSLGSGII